MLLPQLGKLLLVWRNERLHATALLIHRDHGDGLSQGHGTKRQVREGTAQSIGHRDWALCIDHESQHFVPITSQRGYDLGAQEFLDVVGSANRLSLDTSSHNLENLAIGTA